MSVLLSITLLSALFVLLGFATTIVVNNIKKIAETLGVPLFFLGLILGILTSFPEFSIAINASINGVPEVSIGNLFGGIFVVFGLILGLGLILNRQVKTDGNIMTLIPGFVLLLTPLILGSDGVLNVLDGIFICLGYVGILTHTYLKNKQKYYFKISVVQKNSLIKEIIFVISGTLVVLVASHLIMQITVKLLENFAVSGFIIGLIIFSLGTNLPELMVIIASWQKKIKELSFSHMLGSALVNAAILGMMAVASPLTITVDPSYILICYFLIIMLTMLLYFYRSGKKLSRPEGVVLVLLFALFGYLQTVVQ